MRQRGRGKGTSESAGRVAVERFPAPERFTFSGKQVGDICFECQCRILEIGGPEGMVLAWCECSWPDDHGEMQVG